MHSAVPEIFHTQTKIPRLTAPKTELRAVKKNMTTVLQFARSVCEEGTHKRRKVV